MTIPCGIDIKQVLDANQSFSKGNFALWFNKFVPLSKDDDFAACDVEGNKVNAVQYYFNKYVEIRKNNSLSSALSKKHQYQKDFCKQYKDNSYAILEIKAVLTSPLITGIGQTHPNEIGMVFDHTLGIPYIPASSIKGIVRFAHILYLIKNDPDNGEYINFDKNILYESHLKTKIPDLFGGDLTLKKDNDKEKPKVLKKRGQVIFLDAYSERVPELHIDIMNPHYGDYYQDETGEKPPTDNMKLNPIKFLTIARGTRFVFRAIIPLNSELKEIVKRNYMKALTEEGVGAKTAVGYGRFEIEYSKLDFIDQKKLDEDNAKKEENKRKVKAKEQEEARRTQLEEARRTQLGWDGRLLEDLQTNLDEKAFNKFQSEVLKQIEENKEINSKHVDKLKKELLEKAEQVWGKEPKIYWQKDALSKMKKLTGFKEKEIEKPPEFRLSAGELEESFKNNKLKLDLFDKIQLLDLKKKVGQFKRSDFIERRFQRTLQKHIQAKIDAI